MDSGNKLMQLSCGSFQSVFNKNHEENNKLMESYFTGMQNIEDK